ncbi:hypothetical protein [Paenibacillus radicis (ex Xue et al. 2023)]|uniref:Uncharacterized protein n=1 Tax=Paenibacillus radicis (ex Xue et al. 2023) TaxID=2972489 RepID=A0ABT1YSD0_9BACL|nr:hypothetical protein [Paenibacillus radicis (ex Xue et al. 2023)]MCR8635264.1 hypothetical protein [Paenibacillus radicis (ex Xue et al. 2023)]
MLTYCLLALAAIYILNRWVQFNKIRRSAVSLESIDTDLQNRLNGGEHSGK